MRLPVHIMGVVGCVNARDGVGDMHANHSVEPDRKGLRIPQFYPQSQFLQQHFFDCKGLGQWSECFGSS